MERRKRADGGMECGVDDAGMNGALEVQVTAELWKHPCT